MDEFYIWEGVDTNAFLLCPEAGHMLLSAGGEHFAFLLPASDGHDGVEPTLISSLKCISLSKLS